MLWAWLQMVNDDLMLKALEEKQGIPVDITQN